MKAIFLLAVMVVATHAKLKEYDGVISDEDHYADEHDESHDHNSKYDHEAFLGKDEAKHFDEMAPEDSREKLGEMYDKIDTNSDKQVTADELKAWMVKAQHRYAEVDAAENMKLSDKDKNNKMTFDEFKATSYGFLNADGGLKDVFDPEEYPKFHKDGKEKIMFKLGDQNVQLNTNDLLQQQQFQQQLKQRRKAKSRYPVVNLVKMKRYLMKLDKDYYAKQVARDERRFKLADKNADGALDAEELPGFLHPETAEHMRIVSAQETIEDMDKDKDNHISMDEFLADLKEQDGKDLKVGEEPDWLKDEKKNFTEVHDTNKDGKLDSEEVKKWIFPTEEDYLGDEAKHLIKEADTNHDGMLTKEEMLEKQDVFVGSQATDFGEMLHGDEL